MNFIWPSNNFLWQADYGWKSVSLTVLLVLLIIQDSVAALEGNHTDDGEGGYQPEEEKEGSEPADAITFPFFVLALGVIAYRLLSRYAEWLPYTGFMFLLGTFIGVGVTRVGGPKNLLNESIIDFWLPIDSELLLVSFLPGLLYHDAAGQNSHLFRAALNQCLIFAFPMVLAGTTLTALVAYYIFPYNWSFQLAMTFGSILSATDPVAVAALLEHVGAPPRLKVHIAGEALLNDGSAIVFFSIFSGMYLLELGVEGLGESVDLASGVKLFFQKSVGGACIGALFGLGLLSILYLLNRRLDREENVTQVGATITVAYLCYFVADVAWGSSGVIAVVTLGVMTKALGETYINDPKLMADFWSIVEWLLNTVLFALGGLVWGSIVGNEGDKDFPEREFTGTDWGYLILLYLLLTIIRFGLFVCVYPIISRIGLGTSWKELIFEVYSGLRGALGISLAIFLDNIVKANVKDPEASEFAQQTNKLFGFVGGIAFLTLMINGVLAGPLLKYLGLADTSNTRKRMMNCYLQNNRQKAIRDFIDLMRQRRFRKVNFAVIRAHVPFLRDVSRAEVIEAANQAFTQMDAQDTMENETTIHLDGVLTFLNKIDDVDTDERTLQRQASSTHSQFDMESIVSDDVIYENNPTGGSDAYFGAAGIPAALRNTSAGELTANEFRRLFLELVRACYRKQIESGELGDRGFVVLALMESLELAAESVERENRLNDWDYVFLVRHPSVNVLKYFQQKTVEGEDGEGAKTNKRSCMCCSSCLGICASLPDSETIRTRVDTEKCLAFILAHTTAQSIITEYFFSASAGGNNLAEVIEQKILAESEAQVAMAEAHLQSIDKSDVELAVSHKVCKILLNNTVKYFETLVENGLLKDQEVVEFYEEIQSSLFHIDSCKLKKHGGEYHSKKSNRGPKGHEQASESDESVMEGGVALGTNNLDEDEHIESFPDDDKASIKVSNDPKTKMEAGGDKEVEIEQDTNESRNETTSYIKTKGSLEQDRPKVDEPKELPEDEAVKGIITDMFSDPTVESDRTKAEPTDQHLEELNQETPDQISKATAIDANRLDGEGQEENNPEEHIAKN